MNQQNLIELIDTGIVRLDGQQKVALMNSAAEQCFGMGRDKAIGRSLSELTAISDEMLKALDKVDQSESGVMRLHDLKLVGGHYDCTIRIDDQGMLLLELHNLEWEHRRLRLQQREVQTGLLELLSRNLGHEIRNPLGGIRGASQMLANELESPDLVTLARLVMREADRIDELIQSFGQPQLARNDVDLYPLLDEVFTLTQVEFGTDTKVERDFDPSIPTIKGDRPAIRQVMLNLIRNAYQSGASTILVTTRVEHGGAILQNVSKSLLRIDVVDDGEGVPLALRNLLFLPMVTGKRNGTGLGLALSQQIAAAHDGILTFEPQSEQSGAGSCFSFYLPLEKSISGESLGESS